MHVCRRDALLFFKQYSNVHVYTFWFLCLVQVFRKCNKVRVYDSGSVSLWSKVWPDLLQSCSRKSIPPVHRTKKKTVYLGLQGFLELFGQLVCVDNRPYGGYQHTKSYKALILWCCTEMEVEMCVLHAAPENDPILGLDTRDGPVNLELFAGGIGDKMID